MVRVTRLTQPGEQETMMGAIIQRNNSWHQTVILGTRKRKESKMTQGVSVLSTWGTDVTINIRKIEETV